MHASIDSQYMTLDVQAIYIAGDDHVASWGHVGLAKAAGPMQPQAVSCLLRPGCIKGPVH